MNNEETARMLAGEYFAEQPDLTSVIWLPTTFPHILCLLLVFREQHGDRRPMRLHTRFNDFECRIATVTEPGWQDVLRGDTPLWENWSLEGHRVIARPA